MSDLVIRVENLGKRYRIGARKKQANTLRESLQNLVASPFDYLRSTLRGPSEEEIIWSLKDVSFEVKQGEVVGIIGRNGAGKTTLLKVLSRITEPTEGRAILNGRVASLLAVGTGFHPELTGRENIYLNGAILGMKRAEIERKFDEIVAFAEIEKFMDTPVKHYSSGMYVRLAFAVAAHLEPEILLVDEVLAVGDAAFQKKCLGKMGDVAREGRTVLFVSHNMPAVEHLCSRAVLLNEGRLVADDKATRTISHYLQTASAYSNNGLAYSVNRDLFKTYRHPDIQITDIALLSPSGEPLQIFGTGDPLVLRIHYEAKRQFASQAFVVHMNNHFGQRVVQLNTTPISGYPITHLAHKGCVDLVIESLPLTAGRYYFDVGFVREKTEWIIKLEEVIALDVGLKDVYGSGMALDNSRGVVVVPHYWLHSSEGNGQETLPAIG